MPGTTTGKILVIEADDYGSINMPSKKAYNNLKEKGLINASKTKKNDSLETPEDLYELYKVLKKYLDSQGSPAKFTPFFNSANPDFSKIEEAKFRKYYHRTYRKTVSDYDYEPLIHDLWKEGVEETFCKPQYHGREHLNVPVYMELLKDGNEIIHNAFSQQYCFPVCDENEYFKRLRPAFYFENLQQLEYLKKSLISGIELFREYFGYSPVVFCPSNGIFHTSLKKTLFDQGIPTIVESGVRYEPDGCGGLNKKRRFVMGKKDSVSGLISYPRNVTFEPLRDGKTNSIKKALKEIQTAFRWSKPAVIATHRHNFSGGIYPENREHGLAALDQLLNEVVKTWPDIEFMNSEELSDLLHEKQN